MQTDVLIIGAGPTGLALACQLIRYGIDFVIIDKKETTTPFSKAIGVQARTLELYEQLGIADDLVSIGARANGARLFVKGKQRGELAFGDMGDGLSSYPYVLIAEQGKHETLLYDYIKSNGRDIRWQTALEAFTQNDNGVSATLTLPDGKPETVEAKYMVACDGAKSPVRHSLGLEFSGSTFERMFYVADVEIDWQYGRGGLFGFLMPRNLLVVFTMNGERNYRIVGTFPEEFAKDEGDILYDEIEQQLKKDAQIDFDITKVNWFSTYKVHTRHVSKFSVGRCFLAGDSAHIHSPAGGQGMNTGIQDGYNLGWKLALVVRDGAAARLLDTYNEERLPNAVTLTQTTDRFFGIIADPNPFLVFLRMYVFPYIAKFLSGLQFARRFAFMRISQIAINYRGLSLARNEGSFTVKAGDRMPWFKIDGESVYDRLLKPGFHIVAFGDTAANGVPDVFADIADYQQIQLTNELKKLFGSEKPFMLVIRPDNYIGMISQETSISGAEKYLRDTLGSTVNSSPKLPSLGD